MTRRWLERIVRLLRLAAMRVDPLQATLGA
jgi:hypothetical protein